MPVAMAGSTLSTDGTLPIEHGVASRVLGKRNPNLPEAGP